MRASTVVLSLAAAVSATDILFAPSIRCGGAHVACRDIPADACCYVNDKTMDFSSQFVKLPNNTIAAGFNREQSGSNTGDAHSCGGGVSSGEFSPDGNDVCLPASAPRYSISCSQWSIYEKGKSPRPVCAGTYKAETVVLGDGTTYTVKNMDLKLEEELYQFAWNGTTKEGIPQSYADYQIKIWI